MVKYNKVKFIFYISYFHNQSKMNYLKLSPEKLNLNDINDLVVHDSCGGIAFFIGTTRDSFEDKKVSNYTYFFSMFFVVLILLSHVFWSLLN